MRSLSIRLILAFMFVSISGTILAALIARYMTVSEFNQFVFEQAQSNFITEVSAYYLGRGSWDGVVDYLRVRNLSRPYEPSDVHQPGLPPPEGQSPPRPNSDTRPGVVEARFGFVLVDQDGYVVMPAGSFQLGDLLTQAELGEGTAVEIDGEVVGSVLAAGGPPPLALNDERYLTRTNQALLYASLGATVLALILGVILARTLTFPLREMTSAVQSMAEGDLEQRVEVRSQDELGDLASAFNQMSADLANANELRDRLTADIAHDLRTPLTVIAGYLESLRDGVLDPSPDRFDVMYTEIKHLQRLVEDLRTLSLADAGNLTLNMEPITPYALLDRQAATFRDLSVQQGIEFQIQVEPDLPMVNVDVERMTQVLGNLISNALRHTPGGNILLSCIRQDKTLVFKVRDTGEGIPTEAIPHVFERFYRADSARHQQGSESGLGLAIARSLVKEHGGTITVASEVGIWTEFTIHLPLT